MSTHNYKVLKNYPVQYIVKNPRHWWQTINTTYSEDTTVDVELRPFEGLEYTFNNPLITFSRQTLLDNTILEESTYALGESGKEYTYGDGTNTIQVVGTLTEADGVYSGFTGTTNYLVVGELPLNNGLSWEMVTKITTGENVTSGQLIFSEHNVAYQSYCSIDGGKFRASVSHHSSSTAKALVSSDTAITPQPNTTYWVKFMYEADLQKYSLYSKTDNGTWNLEASLSLNRVQLAWQWDIGCCGHKSDAPFLGSIDLKETYIKIDGKIVWDYNNTKYYMGCLETFDKVSEYTYTALVKDGEVLLVDTDQLRTGYTWANGVTIPTHEKLLDNYFAPVTPVV